MEGYCFTKSDWTLFRNRIGDWREAYMDRLNKEYIELLQKDAAPSDKFWELEKRIREDMHKVGVRLRMSKSNLVPNVMSLINDGVIEVLDLDEFSDEFRERINFLLESQAYFEE